MAVSGDETDVLVVGAGPSGLTAAVELARRGVNSRVVDRRLEPRPGTRGCTVWHRTLEVFDIMGLPVNAYLDQGVRFTHRIYHVLDSSPEAVEVTEPTAPYPQPLIVGQPVTERLLAARLAELGGTVERGLAAESVTMDSDGCDVVLTDARGARRTVRARWVVVAEGSHSRLRDALGIGWASKRFPGTQLLQVDARIDGEMPGSPQDPHLFLASGGTLGDLPLPDGRRRLFMSVADPDPGRVADPELAEIEPLVRRMSGRPDVSLYDARFNWRIRLHNSIAEDFRVGRCLLIGDSARTFMPVGAQGMNTGIQDAFNLAWKLAAVVTGQAGEALIDTYAAERRPLALELLERTERGFWGGVGQLPPADLILAGIRRQRDSRSELAIGYRDGRLATERLDREGARAGDRAPDAGLHDGDRSARVFDTLRHGGWTLLAFAGANGLGEGDRDLLRSAATALPGGLVARAIGRAEPAGSGGLLDPDGAAHAAYGAAEGALCLIRPDGHLGFRGPLGDGAALMDYLKRVTA